MSFDIKCVNRIKVEEYKDFKESIFFEVYEKASALVKNTIEENEANETKSEEANVFAEGNYICNIIAFIGKRGMGKSSAMLSFVYSLKNSSYFPDKKFYVLPKIDMSMVTSNESLLDIILAYMWDEYEKIDSKLYSKESSMMSLKRKFVDVKDSYMRFKKANMINYEEELYSVKELKSLAKSLQLRNTFSSLVRDFLERIICDNTVAPADRYLVFVIDDLDLVSNKPNEVFEQIKNFLSIPHTIVLTTLDIERGILNKHNELEKNFSERYQYNDGNERLLGYATDYMAKVIPFSKRIYMPDIQEKNNKQKIQLDIYGDKLGFKESANCPNEMDYEQYCNLLLYKYANIMTNPQMGCVFGENESLRGIVNGLNSLYNSLDENMSQEENKLKAIEWIKKETMVIAEKLDSDELYNFYINNCKYPWYRFADFMVQSIYFYTKKEKYIYDYEKGLVQFENSLNNIRYSDMLAFFVALKRKVYITDWNKIKNVLWVYAAVYENIEVREVFSRFIGEAVEGIIEKDTYLPGIFNITLMDIRKTRTRFSDDDYKKLIDIVKCALFTDINRLVHSNVQIKNKPQKQLDEDASYKFIDDYHMEIEVEKLIVKISFDSFIENMCNYEESCDKVIDWILNVIYATNESSIELDRTTVVKKLHNILNIDMWREWKEKFKINSINDLFPLNSLGYMVGLAERVDSNLRNNPTSLFAVVLKEVKESIFSYMEECEKYYFIEDESKQKSRAWKNMFDIADIESISEERQQLMINKKLEDRSQAGYLQSDIL